MLRCLQLLFCFLTLSMANIAFSEQPEEPLDSSPLHVELLHEDQTIQAAHPFWVALRINLDDEWHAYWQNPGDAGMPITVEWQLPDGFKASPVVWPLPKKFNVDAAVGYGYEKQAILLAQITPPASLSTDKPVDMQATLNWVACSGDLCVPGESVVHMTLSTSHSESVKSHWHSVFTSARMQLPKKLLDFKVLRKDELIELQVNLPNVYPHDITKTLFFPKEENLICRADPILKKTDDTYSIALMEMSPSPSLNGILVFLGGPNDELVLDSFDIDAAIVDAFPATNLLTMGDNQTTSPQYENIGTIAPLATHIVPLDTEKTSENSGFWTALLLAFIGGFILNLMPCVLPVVSFKILSFVKMSGQNRRDTFKHGLAFSSGVLISFWVLAAAILILQSYGKSVGWGFQLQEPLFVAILALVLLVFALNLFGVFEAGMSVTSWAGQAGGKKKSDGLTGSFLSGVLATAIATPCTGPFLGSAVGLAVTLPPILSLLIFTSLGLGMAFPYIILSGFPSLLRFMPKPGPWMVTFKELTGFVMLATVLWLVWVFGAQTSNFALIVLLAGFFIVSLGCWIYGKWGSPEKKPLSRFIGCALAALCLLAGAYSLWMATEFQEPQAKVDTALSSNWEPFSPERITELQKQGRPVFVDFTAKWCLICQANHFILTTDVVSNEFDKLGVVRMKADWTRSDPVVTKALKQFGRSGVPLYVLYGADMSTIILPQVLTTDVVIEYLKTM